MNRVKIDLRNRMSPDQINDIIKVNRLAPGLGTLAQQELGEWISFVLGFGVQDRALNRLPQVMGGRVEVERMGQK